MRIALIGGYREDNLEYHFKDTLDRMGHVTEIFNLRKKFFLLRNNQLHLALHGAFRLSSALESSLYTSLAKNILAWEPDIVFGIDRQIHFSCINYIKEEKPGIMAISINPDALINFGRGYLFASRYDHFFSKDPYIVRFMKAKLDLNAHFLPECFNPYYHKKPDMDKATAEERADIDVLVMGTIYAYRALFLEKLFSAGIKLSIFGNKTRYFGSGKWLDHFSGEYLIGARKSELFYGARIVLNNMHYAEIESVNCKFFEIMGCGGFQLCDHKPGIETLGTPGKEFATFSCVAEAIEKIRYFLTHHEERRQIALAGHKKAMSEFTYEKRIDTIFRKTGLL